MEREEVRIVGYTCMKRSVSAVLMLKDGRTYVGQNLKTIPTRSCPRKNSLPGKDYDLCKNICGTIGHAEDVAIRMALLDHSKRELKGGKMWIFGNHHQCDSCKELCRSHGIQVMAIITNDSQPTT